MSAEKAIANNFGILCLNPYLKKFGFNNNEESYKRKKRFSRKGKLC